MAFRPRAESFHNKQIQDAIYNTIKERGEPISTLEIRALILTLDPKKTKHNHASNLLTMDARFRNMGRIGNVQKWGLYSWEHENCSCGQCRR